VTGDVLLLSNILKLIQPITLPTSLARMLYFMNLARAETTQILAHVPIKRQNWSGLGK